ncbi:MAG TPA: SRPBCC family protein [Candidatus Kapabacteria bacterium]|jgi:uncharacterized membrane protein|nr:SRPBCC family protein [Candidatus Kapabacteria bacterium]
MQTAIRALTEKRKDNLLRSGTGQNSLHEPGIKPSGPDFAGYTRGGKFMESPSVGLAWTGIGIAIGISGLALRRKSKFASNFTFLLGIGCVVRGIRDLLHPTDLMTERETGMKNPAASIQHLEGIKIEESVLIDRPANELYAYWRDLSNLPDIMSNLQRIEIIDDYRSHWYLKGPFGIELDWEAEIYMEKPGELISWRSLSGSAIETAGSVQFEPISGISTKVTIMMKIEPPLEDITMTLGKMLGENPSYQVKEDLLRFKRLMESRG